MAAEGLNERFSKIPTKQKVAIGGLVCAGLAAGFYLVWPGYGEMSSQVETAVRQVSQLEQEKDSYEEKKQKYVAFRAEVTKLVQENRELLKVLPTQSELSSLLQSLHAQAELAGLTITSFDRQGEVRRDFYAEIPVRMMIIGTYHQISRFFYAVGKLKRIVNIQDVTLGKPRKVDEDIVLEATFVAKTFRFLEKPPGAV